MPDRRTHTLLTADGARLAVTLDGPEPGPQRTTLVLAHGWTLTHRHWDEVVERVRAERPDVTVVRWDLRGHGRSTHARLRGRTSMDQLAHDLQRVLRAVVPDGPLVLAGHSMGGMGLMAWARLHPDEADARVTGTLLVSTAVAGLAPSRPGRVVPRAMRLLRRAPPTLRIPRMPPRTARRRAWGPSTPDHVIRRAAAVDGWFGTSTFGGWYPALMAHEEHAGLQVLGRHRVQALVGDLDRITPVRFTEAIADALPDADVVVLPGHGHMLPMERPDVVSQHLLALLSDE